MDKQEKEESVSYFQAVKETAENEDGDVDYFFLGFMVVMSPLALPVYEIGRAAHKAMENE